MVRAVETPKSSGTASSADPRARMAAPKPYDSNAGLKKTGTGEGTTAGDGGALAKPVSVIVTAHNASATLKACLEAILSGAMNKEVETVVVCYACTDDTVSVARLFGALIKLIETKSPSKTAALNLGDTAATAFPRFYVDADAVINIDAIRRVTTVLRTSDKVEAAAPAINIDITQSSWLVRAYFQVWLQRDRVRYGWMGSGVCAVNQMGHGKFHRFPVVMAEDAFLRLHFTQRQRRTITGCVFKIKAPSSLLDVFKQNITQRMGMCEIKDLFPVLLQNENARGVLRDLLGLMRDPSNWLPMCVYIPVSVVADVVARARTLWSWWRPKHRPDAKEGAMHTKKGRAVDAKPRRRTSPDGYDDGGDE
jgi:glycosyltransferase involved in cell wall biosynthesis